MKKILFLSVIALSTPFYQKANAQVCPVNFTCCPIGYVCKKIEVPQKNVQLVQPIATSSLNKDIEIANLQNDIIKGQKEVEKISAKAPKMLIDKWWIDVWHQPTTPENFQIKNQLQTIQDRLYDDADKLKKLMN